MAEPRARHRPRGALQFTPSDLSTLLHAYGSSTTPTHPNQKPHPHHLPLTISTLDTILKDFIIETCHAAALSASYSRRQKLKVDDFKFVLRHDGALLGRVLEQMWKERGLREERRVMDFESVGREGVGELVGLAEVGGVSVGGQEGRKKGRKRKGGKRKAEDGGDGEGGARGKRQKSEE